MKRIKKLRHYNFNLANLLRCYYSII